MNTPSMLLGSALTYIFFHYMFYRMAGEVLESEKISRVKIILLFLCNYALMTTYSVLQINLIINWALIFAFFLLSLLILFRKDKDIETADITAVALIATIVGLSINIIARCCFVLMMDIPLSSLNNNSLDPDNMKRYPVIAAFFISGLILYAMRRSIWKKRLQFIFREHSNMKVFLLLLFVVMGYHVLVLLLFYTPGNDISLKIWGIVPNAFALISVFAIIKFVERFSELNQYREKNRYEREALLKEMHEEEELEETAEADVMTGCKTRAYMEKALRAAMERQAPFLLCFADMDGLKKVNDTWGHEAGDHCIRAVGKVLMEASRFGTDVVARFGGDEFVVLMFSQEPEAMAKRMEEANQRLRSMQETGELRFPVSISYGIACRQEAQTWEELLEISDERMYRMKKQRGAERKQ